MRFIVSFFVLFILCGCVQQSKITNAWTSAEQTKSYHDVVVVALTHDVNAKNLVESDLAKAISRKHIVVYKSLDVFPPGYSKDTPKDEMLSKVRTLGAAAIITVTLLNKETQAHYIPGYPNYAPGFWGYYNFWYPTVYSPGYYRQDRIYYIETNVYDVAADELIWSAKSETYNPSSLTGFSQQLASKLANKLRADGIIAPGARIAPSDKKLTSKN